MKSEHLSFLAVVCLLVAATLGFGVYFYDYRRAIIQLPLAIGATILALCAAEAGRVSGKRSNPTAGPNAPARRHSRRDEAVGVLWLLGAAPAIYLLGFPIGLPLHAFVFLRVKGEGWLAAAVVSAVCLATIVAFVEILGVPLPSDPSGWTWLTDRR